MTGPAEPSTRAHLPAVDGLRGFAILFVLLFHMRTDFPVAPSIFKLGWTGVELFFVLSGFLITRILLDARDRPRYFRDFYVRRTLRIFPIYYVFLLFVVVFSRVLHGSSGRLEDLPWYMTYLQSIPMMQKEFKDGLPWSAHTWTLAIEEQFYWFWPVLVYLVRGRALPYVLGLVCASALVARIVLTSLSSNPYCMQAILPVQVDSLSAGALLAYAVHTGVAPRTLRRIALACVLIGGSVCVFLIVKSGGVSAYGNPRLWTKMPHNIPFLTGLAALFCGALGLALHGPRRYIELLRFRPLVRVGKISYGLYLYHLPLLELMRWLGKKAAAATGADFGWVFVVLELAAFFLVAELSWRFIESPILRLKDRYAPSRLDKAG
jgi:peptidoglycan/LPS O-acetylase OafA/YrhL